MKFINNELFEIIFILNFFFKKLKVTLQYIADVNEIDIKKDTAKYIKAKMVEKATKLAAMIETNQSTNEVLFLNT
jgi:hypothetical protein